MKFLLIFVLTNATLILAQEFDVAQKPQQTRIGVGIMLTEQFKPIKGYEGLYEISNFGRVRSLLYSTKLGIPPHILKGQTSKCGYLVVKLLGKTPYIHFLVWDHFGDKPRNGRRLQVDHIDNNKTNNHIDNLQLLTPRENLSKAFLCSKRSGLPTGVYFNERRNIYYAQIWDNNRHNFLGNFDNVEEANMAYKKALEGLI